MSSQAGSKLLALSPELVEHIISFIGAETLIPTRLTCKVLHDLSFTRFADEYFTVINCWILGMDRYQRIKSILDGSSRIRNRIRHVHLTSSVTEDCSVPAIQLAAKKDQSWKDALRDSVGALYEDARTDIDTMLVNKVLTDLAQQPQGIAICLDLAGTDFPMSDYTRLGLTDAYSQTIFCFIASRTKLDTFVLSENSLPGLDYVMELYERNFVFLMFTVSRIVWRGDMPVTTETFRKAMCILQDAASVEEVSFEIGRVDPNNTLDVIRKVYHLADAMLLANNFSNLTKLYIAWAFLLHTNQALLDAITRCAPTLTYLHTEGLMIKTFLTMAKLETISLQLPYCWTERTQDSPLQAQRLVFVGGDEEFDGFYLSGRDAVKDELRKLLNGGLRAKEPRELNFNEVSDI